MFQSSDEDEEGGPNERWEFESLSGEESSSSGGSGSSGVFTGEDDAKPQSEKSGGAAGRMVLITSVVPRYAASAELYPFEHVHGLPPDRPWYIDCFCDKTDVVHRESICLPKYPDLTSGILAAILEELYFHCMYKGVGFNPERYWVTRGYTPDVAFVTGYTMAARIFINLADLGYFSVHATKCLHVVLKCNVPKHALPSFMETYRNACKRGNNIKLYVNHEKSNHTEITPIQSLGSVAKNLPLAVVWDELSWGALPLQTFIKAFQDASSTSTSS